MTVKTHPGTQYIKETIDWFHDELGISYQVLAAALDVTRGTLKEWRDQNYLPQPDNYEQVMLLQQIKFLLERLFENPEQMLEFLYAPTGELEGKPPFSLLKKGALGELVELLATLETGAFS